jgi:hypothetical protein
MTTFAVDDPVVRFSILLGIDPAEVGDLPFVETTRFDGTDLDYFHLFTDRLDDGYDQYRAYREAHPDGRSLFPTGDLYHEAGGLMVADADRIWIHPADAVYFGAGYAGWMDLTDRAEGQIELNDDAGRIAYRRSEDDLFLTSIELAQVESGTTLHVPYSRFAERLQSQYSAVSGFFRQEAEAWGLPTDFSRDLVEEHGYYYRLMDGLYYTTASWNDDGTVTLKKQDKKTGLTTLTEAPGTGWEFSGFLLNQDLGHWRFNIRHADILTFRWKTVEWYVYLQAKERTRAW